MLYKRRGVYYLDVTVGGRRVRKSTGTQDRRLAEQYEIKIKEELWRVETLGEKPQHIWNEAVVRWVSEKSHLAGLNEIRRHFRLVRPFLDDKRLSEINRTLIDQVKEKRLAAGVSNATVNKTLQAIRGVLRAAKEWGWIDETPVIKLLQEPKRRVRFLTPEEADKLLSALPSHLEAMARFSLSTGLRMSNVTGLEWSQVDLQRRCAWIHPDQAKARKAIPVPLNDDAVAVIRKELGKNFRYVFSYKGQQVKRTNGKAWRKALKAAKIGDFRWHDLRHTWASWHVQNGTPMQVLQELGGWSDFQMVSKYAHLGQQHLAKYAGNVTNRTHAENDEKAAGEKS